MLYEVGLEMAQKAFAIGVRIEHPQDLINKSQYGKFHNHPKLKAADYKLTYQNTISVTSLLRSAPYIVNQHTVVWHGIIDSSFVVSQTLLQA